MERTPPLSAVAGRIRPPVFAALQARIDELARCGADTAPFHLGDTWRAPPAAARSVLARVDADDASLYRYGATAGLPELRKAMAARLPQPVDPDTEVLLGNGGTHALFCAARAILDAGDEVLLASPYWPLSPGVFTMVGAVPIDVPLTQALYADATETLDAGAAFAAKVTPRTKALYVSSPNNPDGKVLSLVDLESIARVAIEHDLWVFSDEVYAEMVFGRPHLSIATLPGMRARTVVLHSLSKSHSLAGARIGFCAAPASVVAAGRRVSVHSAFNMPVLLQHVALAALSDLAYTADSRVAFHAARDEAARRLVGSGVSFYLADGGAYLFLDFTAHLRGRPLSVLLEAAVERGVLLAPGDAFGDGWGAHARLCYTSVPVERLNAGVDRLVDAIHSTR